MHLLENTFDRKRIFSNPSSNLNPNSNPNSNPKQQQCFRNDVIFRVSVQIPQDRPKA